MNIDLETCFLLFLIGFALYLLVNRVFKVEGVTSPPWSCDNRPPASGNCPDSQCLNTTIGVWACPGEKKANCDSPSLTWCSREEKSNLDGYKLLTPKNTIQDDNSFLKSKNGNYYNIKLMIKSFKIDGKEYVKEGKEFISYELSPVMLELDDGCAIVMLYTRENNLENLRLISNNPDYETREIFSIFNLNDINNLTDGKEILKYSILSAEVFQVLLLQSESPNCTVYGTGETFDKYFYYSYCESMKTDFYGMWNFDLDGYKLTSKHIRQNEEGGINFSTSVIESYRDGIMEHCGQNTEIENYKNIEMTIQIYGKETDAVPLQIGYDNLEIDCSNENINCINIPCSEVCPP